MKQYMVYLEVPVIAVGKMAIFVTDEDDLKNKMTKLEEDFRKQPLTYKPQRGEKGKIVFHQLSSDWDLKD